LDAADALSMQIHKAALRGDKEAVLRQLSLGTPVDVTGSDSWGSTSLMLAAGSEHADVSLLQVLISHGANVNAIGVERGETPFSCASSDVKKMQYLLKVGADPFIGAGASKKIGWTTSTDANRFLLELGFDPTVVPDNGCPSRLDAAVHYCDWQQVKLFAEFGFEYLDWSELMRDIIFGDTQTVAEHLKNGADIEIVDSWHRTPMLLSICSGSVPKAKLILTAGGDLEDRAHCDESALDCAILSKSSEMLKWLLSLGLDANMRGVINQTPLMSATEQSNAFAVEILLAHGAVIDATTEQGEQAISMVQDPATANHLVVSGADINYIDGMGNFPLKAAVEQCNFELVRSLLELGANVNNRSLGKAALHQAANYDELEIMKLLLAAGADPNLPEEDAWRPLWVVHSREAAQILLDAGASTSAMDDIGYTAYEFHKDADIRALLRRR